MQTMMLILKATMDPSTLPGAYQGLCYTFSTWNSQMWNLVKKLDSIFLSLHCNLCQIAY